MASLKERVTSRVRALRQRRRGLDHAIRTQEHYSAVKGTQWAGAVTYFGFLSVFPILAIAFFAVGYVSRVFPDAQDTLIEAINTMLPGLIGTEEGDLQLEDIENAATTVGLIGLVALLYTGLGWLSALRNALITVFERPAQVQPNFVMGKVRDLITLALLGVVMLVAVALTGFAAGFSEDLVDWLGFGTPHDIIVRLVTIGFGLAANMVLIFMMFRLLASPGLPWKALWSGALLGAIGFEILKQISDLLIRITENAPAFQVYGLALILLVWINYSSRDVLYAAAWAWTAPAALAQRVVEPAEPVQGPPSVDDLPADEDKNSRKGAFVAGAAAGAAAAAVIKSKVSGDKSD